MVCYIQGMRYLLMLMLIAIAPTTLTSQLFEDFSDGEITTSPSWYGDVGDFIVNEEFKLQLNADGAGMSSVWTTVDFPDSIAWLIDIELDFSPSQSNRLRYYLMADHPNAEQVENGYFIEIGRDGPGDGVSLNVIDQGVEYFLAESQQIEIDDRVEIKLKVTRNLNGIWTIFQVSEAVLPVISVTDLTVQPENCDKIILRCDYTASRSDKFYLDNIAVEELTQDTTPPAISTFEAITLREFRIKFNEAIDNNITPTDIRLNPGQIKIDSVVFGELNRMDVHTGTALQDGGSYILEVDNIRDMNGNETHVIYQTNYWITHQANPGEIVINELMPDPSPAIGLPEVEYIELFNASDRRLGLSDLNIEVNNASFDLRTPHIPPGEYLILCPAESAEHYAVLGATESVSSWKQLPNSSGAVTLYSDAGIAIDHISYSIDWYGYPDIANGGWSLERINPYLKCSDAADFWSGSVSMAGGTPGASNSVLNTQFSVSTPPAIMYLLFNEPAQTLTLRFNRALNTNPDALDVKVTHLDIESATIRSEDLDIKFKSTLETGVGYTLIMDSVEDCAGYIMPPGSIEFERPGVPKRGSIVINELMLEPVSHGVSYIEIHNVSDDWHNLSNCYLIISGSSGQSVIDIPENVICGPGELFVFTESADILKQYYSYINPFQTARNSRCQTPGRKRFYPLAGSGWRSPGLSSI